MKNILALTDFSENAKAAEKYTLQLAIHAKANLILYNVYPNKRQTASGNVVWPHDAPPSLELQSISNLQAEVNELNHELDKIKSNNHKPEISHSGNAGSLSHKLNEIIRDNNIWLVVMGTKGESFSNNVLFGSNVYKVLEKINCPVLIIPKNTEYKNLQKIVYATDFRSSDLKIVEWLYELVNALKIELSIVHVSSDTITDQQNGTLKKQEKTYQSKFPKTTIKLYQGKNIQHSLHEIVEKMAIDLLALMHRKYNFFESLSHPSTSHKMIKHTEIPVLVFPDLQEE
jgi:nucleotide-binding universal stress UspA family protein